MGERDDNFDLACALLLTIPQVLLAAWVGLKLYEWHVMPVWEAAPTLGYGRAFGLMLLLSLLKGHGGGRRGEDGYTIAIVARMLTLLVALLLGWLAAG